MDARTRESGSDIDTDATGTSGAWRVPAQGQSDIRGILNRDAEQEMRDEATEVRRRDVPFMPLLADFSHVLALLGDDLPKEGEAFRALQQGDLPRAISILAKENAQLRSDVEAGKSDFDALLAVNRSIQQQMDEALSVADDQRLALLEELEFARDQVLAMEAQTQDMQVQYEAQLLDQRQWIEDLEAEIFDVRDELAACRSQIGS
jgi:hypothetical protein